MNNVISAARAARLRLYILPVGKAWSFFPAVGKALLGLMLLAPLSLTAQNTVEVPVVEPLAQPAPQPAATAVKFGYFSFDSVFRSLPDYAIAERSIADLRLKYEAELKRAEDEFNQKYEEFLQGQRDFAPSIREKRQAELEELMEKNTAFKGEARRLLSQAEDDAFRPLRKKVAAAVERVSTAHGYAFVLNTDRNAVPFVNPAYGEDITPQLNKLLIQRH